MATERKKIKANSAIDGEDRISSLPDGIISHILSFLPIKYAITTSILSKRWRHLWTNITSILLVGCYISPEDGVPAEERFKEVVDRVLHQCTSQQLQRFHIHSFYHHLFDRVKAWINEAIRRNVRELDLNIHDIPSCVFTCKTLAVLKLYIPMDSVIETPPFYLPSLRTLSIDGSDLPRDLTENLFRSCPVLEDLHLRYSIMKDVTFIISAPLLKRFKSHGDGYRPLEEISSRKFVINAPNLEYLDIYDKHITEYKFENLSSSIAEAIVDVRGDFEFRYIIANRAVELLRGLSGVKSLFLGSMTMTALGFAYDQLHHLPIFYNMTQLELINVKSSCGKILPRLLQVCPKLKALIIVNKSQYPGNFYFGYAHHSDYEPQKLPECLSSCLELVEIEGFEGTENELIKVVEYILLHAAVLKRLSINLVRGDSETKANFRQKSLNLRQKLLDFPRSSTTCQVYLLNLLGNLVSSS